MGPSGLTLAMALTKYGIYSISAKNGPITTKQKTNIWIEI